MSDPELLPPDDFPLAADDPLHAEHRFLQQAVDDVLAAAAAGGEGVSSQQTGPYDQTLDRDYDGAGRAALLHAAARRWRHVEATLPPGHSSGWPKPLWAAHTVVYGRVIHLTYGKAPGANRDWLLDLAAACAASRKATRETLQYLAKAAAAEAKAGGLSEDVKAHLAAAARTARRWHAASDPYDPVADKLDTLAGVPLRGPLVPGEPWADTVLKDMNGESPEAAADWNALLTHCYTAKSATPSAAWRKRAAKALEAVELHGAGGFAEAVARWFPLVAEDRTAPPPRKIPWWGAHERYLEPYNAQTLRGLTWCCGLPAAGDRAALVDPLSALADAGYEPLDGIGPRAAKVGNAAVWALGEIPGAAIDALLRRIRDGATDPRSRKSIGKALAARGT